MNSTILTSMIFGLIIGSAIGGAILLPLAKNIGKIMNANYLNSFLVCLIASAINFIIWYSLGTDAFRIGFISIFILNLIILSVSYIVIGKYIWKCSWIQSIKGNSIWIIVYAISMGYLLNKIS